MSRTVLKSVFITLVLLFSFTNLACAALVTEYFKFSGASFGNTALATGSITFDPATMNNPGLSFYTFGWNITNFTITVTGSSQSSYNNTFSLSNYGDFVLDTNGGTLDFAKSLIGQQTSNPPNPQPWGTAANGAGSFTLFAKPASFAPTSQNSFVMQISNSNEKVQLTEMGPATAAVPEPSTYLLLTIALGVVGYTRKRMNQA